MVMARLQPRDWNNCMWEKSKKKSFHDSMNFFPYLQLSVSSNLIFTTKRQMSFLWFSNKATKLQLQINKEVYILIPVCVWIWSFTFVPKLRPPTWSSSLICFSSVISPSLPSVGHTIYTYLGTSWVVSKHFRETQFETCRGLKC